MPTLSFEGETHAEIVRKVRRWLVSLDQPEEVEHLYFTAADKPWLVNHWNTQTEKGNGFAAPQLSEDGSSVPTLTKRYQAIRGDAPVLAHHKRPGAWRLFTISETMRLHGLDPTAYQLDRNSKNISGEVLGQGVIVSFFEKIIRATRNLIPSITPQRPSHITKREQHDLTTNEMDMNFTQTSLAFA